MRAKLVKIDPPKSSRNGDVQFQRLHFQLQDGSYAMTDVVSTFRNYAWWQPVIEAGIGTWIDGVELKGKQKIDADSWISIYQAALFSSGVDKNP